LLGVVYDLSLVPDLGDVEAIAEIALRRERERRRARYRRGPPTPETSP